LWPDYCISERTRRSRILTLDETSRSIETLLADAEFKRLTSSLSSSTIFHVIGADRNERAHSQVLGWLLAPSQPHGLESGFLRNFLVRAAQAARARGVQYPSAGGEPLQPLMAQVLSLTDVRVDIEFTLPDQRRPDLVLSSPSEGWLCVVENKIDSLEGTRQTEAYYEEAQREDAFPPNRYPYRLFVYLTPQGQVPRSPYFTPMSYGTIREILTSLRGEGASALGQVVLDQYGKCLETNVMMNEDELRKVCRYLYRQHREAIDAIYAYGRGSALAQAVLTGVLEGLQSTAIIDTSGNQVEWTSSSGVGWMALWPRHWPTRPGYYPAYYGMWFDPAGRRDAIKMNIGFNTPDGPNVRRRYAEVVGGDKSIAPVEVEARGPESLAMATREGVTKLRALIDASIVLVERAYREAVPEGWAGGPR
jgi:hypothetical protein